MKLAVCLPQLQGASLGGEKEDFSHLEEKNDPGCILFWGVCVAQLRLNEDTFFNSIPKMKSCSRDELQAVINFSKIRRI